MARASHGIGEKRGHGDAGTLDADGRITDDKHLPEGWASDDLAETDQRREACNQRLAVPDESDRADESVLESFDKMDKDVRAERDLGKGGRGGKG